MVLAWESTRGEMRVCSPKSRPLKTALPNVAEAPQQNAAAAIKILARDEFGRRRGLKLVRTLLDQPASILPVDQDQSQSGILYHDNVGVERLL